MKINGHSLRMSDNRIPKVVLAWASKGKRRSHLNRRRIMEKERAVAGWVGCVTCIGPEAADIQIKCLMCLKV